MRNNLLICDSYPLPEISGADMRTMHYARALTRLGNLDIAFRSYDQHADLVASIFCHKYHLETIQHPKGALRKMYYNCKNIPYPITCFTGTEVKRMVHIINSGYYNNIVVRYLRNVSSLAGVHKDHLSKIIVDIDDVMNNSVYETFFEHSLNPLKRMVRSINKYHVYLYQRLALSKFKSVFCSGIDMASCMTGHSRSFVIPNVYTNEVVTSHTFGEGYGNRNCLLFVGLLKYPPNVNGLKWFISEIYRKFSDRYADAECLVVGRDPCEDVKSICSEHGNIELHADVESLVPYYERARAVVVPILAGGGTRIKILEAGLTGRPVLSTPIGAYGLDLRDGKDILLFDNSEEFMLRYEELSNREKYESLSQSLKDVVTKKYSADAFENALYKVLT